MDSEKKGEQEIAPAENEEDTVQDSTIEKIVNFQKVNIPQGTNENIEIQQDQTNNEVLGGQKMDAQQKDNLIQSQNSQRQQIDNSQQANPTNQFQQANMEEVKLNQNEIQNQNQVPISSKDVIIQVQQQDQGMQSNLPVQEQKQENLKPNEKEVKPAQQMDQKNNPYNQKPDLKQDAQLEAQALLQTQQNEENNEAQDKLNLDNQLKLQKNQSSALQAQMFKGYQRATAEQAEAHKEAKRVKDLSNIPKDQYLNFICDCCHLPLGGKPYELCCDNSKLLSLGTGFPLYFGYIKYQIALMIMSFAFGLPMFIACMIKGGDLNKNNDDNNDDTVDISFPRMSSVASY